MSVGIVKQTNAQMRHAVLGCHEGHHLLSAQEVILKSVLESESRIALIAGPKHDPFQPVFGITSNVSISELLARHETEIVPTHDAGRAVRLAMYAAQAGQKALATTAVPSTPAPIFRRPSGGCCGAVRWRAARW